MANAEHLAILKQGVAAWNKWREEHPYVHPDLSGADLSGADLSRANLQLAKLRGAYLIGADLTGANLIGADVGGANLSEADLAWADLTGANLSGANLSLANLALADLYAADVSRAHFAFTVLGDNDLSRTKGLDTVEHSAPSTIGIDTIQQSGGKIPEVFLRGAGVPDNWIKYIGSLVGQPPQFYSCFISYSTKDQEFADRLHADLQAKGVRCWLAPEDMRGGRKLHEQIVEAIRLHERLLVVLSESSMTSHWVKTEIASARKRELQEGRRVLFPVRLVAFAAIQAWECFDADTGQDLAAEIRSYFIPDFSDWKDHDSYQKTFDGLLRDLKAAGAAAASAP